MDVIRHGTETSIDSHVRMDWYTHRSYKNMVEYLVAAAEVSKWHLDVVLDTIHNVVDRPSRIRVFFIPIDCPYLDYILDSLS